MDKINLLVFPCGSEIGLEICRSLKYSAHINLIGANSIDDHGRFAYDQYIGGLPWIDSNKIIPALKKIVLEKKIDAVYPTMDKVICKLKLNQKKLGVKVISSDYQTTNVCLSKIKTYKEFKDKLKIPKIFSDFEKVKNYPVFVKTDVSYGSKEAFKINSKIEAKMIKKRLKKRRYLILEYLPNEEYTVDCFTNKEGKLLFTGPRIRQRVANGISINTRLVPVNKQIEKMAQIINRSLNLRGAWFFQVKGNKKGNLTLLEIAARLGGSSSLNRMLGINFALLSIYDAFDTDVKIKLNKYKIELDRALDNKYKIDLNYSTVYVDLDDCLLINNKVNQNLAAFLYKSFNKRKKIILITKSEKQLTKRLKDVRLYSLFDQIIQVPKNSEKYKFIKRKGAIFIDDSFSERNKVAEKLNLPTFSPDMVECL